MKYLGKKPPYLGERFVAQQGLIDRCEHYRQSLIELADELRDLAGSSESVMEDIFELQKKARISAGEKVK